MNPARRPRFPRAAATLLVLVASVGCGGNGSQRPAATAVATQAAAYWDKHPEQIPEACLVFVGTFARAPGDDPESGGGLHISRENLERNLASLPATAQRAYTERLRSTAGNMGVPDEARAWDWTDQVEFLRWVFNQCVERKIVTTAE